MYGGWTERRGRGKRQQQREGEESGRKKEREEVGGRNARKDEERMSVLPSKVTDLGQSGQPLKVRGRRLLREELQLFLQFSPWGEWACEDGHGKRGGKKKVCTCVHVHVHAHDVDTNVSMVTATDTDRDCTLHRYVLGERWEGREGGVGEER